MRLSVMTIQELDLIMQIRKALGTFNPTVIGGRTLERHSDNILAYEVPLAYGGKDFGIADAVSIAECLAADGSTSEILVTCYQIKVSRTDLSSGRGLIGNCNFYILPKGLYTKVADTLPEGVGVLLYHDGAGDISHVNGVATYPFTGLKKKIDSKYSTISDEAQKQIMLSAVSRALRAHRE